MNLPVLPTCPNEFIQAGVSGFTALWKSKSPASKRR